MPDDGSWKRHEESLDGGGQPRIGLHEGGARAAEVTDRAGRRHPRRIER